MKTEIRRPTLKPPRPRSGTAFGGMPEACPQEEVYGGLEVSITVHHFASTGAATLHRMIGTQAESEGTTIGSIRPRTPSEGHAMLWGQSGPKAPKPPFPFFPWHAKRHTITNFRTANRQFVPSPTQVYTIYQIQFPHRRSMSMPFTANVLELLLAAPNDTKDELNSARMAIFKWNAAHAKHSGQILLPRYWELDTARDFGAAPQDSIDSQIVQPADILIAIFRNKFGHWTEHEIDKHTQNKKPALVYFCSGNVPRDDMTAAIELDKFKKKCQGQNYFYEYQNSDDLSESLSQSLAILINQRFPKQSIHTEPSAPPLGGTQQPELTYEAKVILYHASLDSDGEINVDTDSVIKTNGKYLNLNQNPRDQAKWRNAVKILKDVQLIAPHHSGTTACFQLTDQGYKIAEPIAKQYSAEFDRIGTSVEEEESRQAERASDIAAQLHERMYGDGPEWRPSN